jgi:uncharacterized membrane protein
MSTRPKLSNLKVWAVCGALICVVIAVFNAPPELNFWVYLAIQAAVGAGLGALAASIRNGIARRPPGSP